MTRGTHRGILAAEGLRVEPGAVRVEIAASNSGVAGETVPLGMTGDAALQILTSGLTMVQKELRLGIVVPRASQAVPGAQPGADVTVGAELRLVVAVGAGLVSRVCRGRMGRQESGRMVPGARIRRVGPVTIQAL